MDHVFQPYETEKVESPENIEYVVNDSNKVVYTPIKVGEVYRDSLRIVTEGLKPTDRYITKALLSARDGMSVKPRLTK